MSFEKPRPGLPGLRAAPQSPGPSAGQIWRQSDPRPRSLTRHLRNTPDYRRLAPHFAARIRRPNLSGKGQAAVTFRAFNARAQAGGMRIAVRLGIAALLA